MLKKRLFSLIVFLWLTTACAGPVVGVTSAATTESLAASTAESEPPTATVVPTSQPTEVPKEQGSLPSFEPSLKILYLREGNLWIWEESAGTRQLTSGGAVEAFHASPDGRRIAFQRGQSLWVIELDGTGGTQVVASGYLEALSASAGEPARLESFGWFPGRNVLYFSTYIEAGEYPLLNYDLHLAEKMPYRWLEPGQGGRLAFSPDGQLLAISSREWIDVLDLKTNARQRVVDYPGIANYETDYLPQVVWSPDSSGFKTVIPPAAENGVNLGPALFLYVFPTGTVARLASFDLVPLYEGLPVLSPDGAYILYSAYVEPGHAALHLMDSSGAVRIYSDAGQRVTIFGWAPDAVTFLYGVVPAGGSWLGSVSAPAKPFPFAAPDTVQWLDSGHFLAIENGTLIIYWLDGRNRPIDASVTQAQILR